VLWLNCEADAVLRLRRLRLRFCRHNKDFFGSTLSFWQVKVVQQRQGNTYQLRIELDAGFEGVAAGATVELHW
jgi:hypothetical protein